MWTIRRTAPLDELAITVDELRAHSRVFHTDDDDLLLRLIRAAQVNVEGYTGRILTQQTITEEHDYFVPVHWLHIYPITSLVIKYDDADNVEQIVPADSYRMTKNGPHRVHPLAAGWPTALNGLGVVRFEAVAGNADSDDIEDDLKLAVHVLAAHFYEHPEAVSDTSYVTEMPLSFAHLIRPYKVSP